MYAVVTLLLYAFIVVHSAMRVYGAAHDDNLEQEDRLRAECLKLAQARRRRRSSARQNIQNLSLEDAAHDGNLGQEDRLRAEYLKMAQARRRQRRRATE